MTKRKAGLPSIDVIGGNAGFNNNENLNKRALIQKDTGIQQNQNKNNPQPVNNNRAILPPQQRINMQ